MMIEKANQIFGYWQIGEQTGNYERFLTALSDRFTLFSHPLLGRFEQSLALSKIKELIEEREIMKNNLTFSDVVVLLNQHTVCFQFNSKGTVMNEQFAYEGFNIIVLHFKNDDFVGFQEYFGSIDKSWFK
jgi:hypothetical protein